MSTKKKAISPKKDRAARTVDKVAAKRSGAKKPGMMKMPRGPGG